MNELNNTQIPDYRGLVSRPFEGGDRLKIRAMINRISLGIFAYFLLVVYPAYALLRWWWNVSAICQQQISLS